jgi:adenylosuccinate synthase
MFSPNIHCIVVVGAQWGDEGKGKVVDALAERAQLVVRYQGGANAGHTVDAPGGEFVLHQIPAGILHAGTHCVIGNGVVLDAETLFHEIDALVARGITIEGRLTVSDRAHFVLPYHKLLDGESARSKKIGTTSRGIGPAYEDKVGRRGVRVGDLRYPAIVGKLVAAGCERANQMLALSGSAKRCVAGDVERALMELAPRLLPFVADAGKLVWQALADSHTTAGGAAVGAGIGPTAIDAVLGIVKAYTTRVGNGPLPTEASPAEGERLRSLGDEFGATTGRPRRCGWFDAVVVRYAVRVNGLSGLAVTKLDVLDSFETVPVCTHYRMDGGELDDLPDNVAALECVQPVYELMPGWRRSTGDARRLEDLPGEARRYLDRLQELSGAPISYVGVGTKREQLIAV